nr:6796_t:CDS:2 [Entrophospora candida]
MSSDDGDKIPELENNIKILKTTLNVEVLAIVKCKVIEDETDVIFSLVDKFNEINVLEREYQNELKNNNNDNNKQNIEEKDKLNKEKKEKLLLLEKLLEIK